MGQILHGSTRTTAAVRPAVQLTLASIFLDATADSVLQKIERVCKAMRGMRH
jgi:hypothetical protein